LFQLHKRIELKKFDGISFAQIEKLLKRTADPLGIVRLCKQFPYLIAAQKEMIAERVLAKRRISLSQRTTKPSCPGSSSS